MIDPLELALGYINEHGSIQRTAIAQILLPRGDLLTMSGGGHGVRSHRRGTRFDTLEVLLSGEPPRFWNRYAGSAADVLFAYVPTMLVTHYVTRAGGAQRVELRTCTRSRTGVMDLRLALPEGSEIALQRALAALSGVKVLTSSYSLDE